MHRSVQVTLSALVILVLAASAFGQSPSSPPSGQAPQQQGMPSMQGQQGMSCCMMSGGGMGMGVMVTLSILLALLLLSATTALFALTIFLLRRSRAIPTQSSTIS